MQELQETGVRSLVREDPLEKGIATHSRILAWRIPWTEEPSGLQSIGSHRVGHDRSNFTCIHAHTGLIWVKHCFDTMGTFWTATPIPPRNPSLVLKQAEAFSVLVYPPSWVACTVFPLSGIISPHIVLRKQISRYRWQISRYQCEAGCLWNWATSLHFYLHSVCNK